jgi:hypothetical protein
VWPWLIGAAIAAGALAVIGRALTGGSVKLVQEATLGDVFTLVIGLVAIAVPTALWFRERRDRIAAESDARRLRERAAREALMAQALRFHAWIESEPDPQAAPRQRHVLVLSNTSDAPIVGVQVLLSAAGEFQGRDHPDDWPQEEIESVPPVSASGLTRIDITDRMRRCFTGSDTYDYCMIMELMFSDATGTTWERDGNSDLKLVLIGGQRVNMTTRDQADLLAWLGDGLRPEAVDLNAPSWVLTRAVRQAPPGDTLT